MNPKIRTVRVYTQNGLVYIDYRTADNMRYRFSTKIAATKASVNSIERQKFDMALTDLHKKLEYKDRILFKDIAYLALDEGKWDRTEPTQKDYITILERYILPEFGHKDVKKIKPSDIEKFKNQFQKKRDYYHKSNNIRYNKSKTISQSRFNTIFCIPRTIFEYAVRNDYIPHSPMYSVSRVSKQFAKPQNTDVKYYTHREQKLMLNDNESPFLNALLHYLFMTGSRTGEALALHWSDINFDKNIIVIQRSNRKGKIKDGTKTMLNRTIPMSTKLKTRLLKWKEESRKSECVFPNQKNGEYIKNHHSDIIKKLFIPMLDRLGLTYINLYCTRASFASLCIEKNFPMTFVQNMLGHTTLRTTQDFYIKSGLQDQNISKNYIDSLF